MLTYTFSRREKALLLALAIVLVIIAWFVLVFQRTANEITRIDGEIAAVQTETATANAKVAQMRSMQAVIDQYKAAGIEPNAMPNFDNMTPLMTELNAVMVAADTYSISFDQLDSTTASGYVLRGVGINFGCGSYAAAEAIIGGLANGTFPSSIDSVNIADGSAKSSARTSSGSPVSASVHVTFFEKRADAKPMAAEGKPAA